MTLDPLGIDWRTVEGRMEAKRRLIRAERELDRLREREAHFARALEVADGGQYRNDWDAAIGRLVEERKRLRSALEEIATPAVGRPVNTVHMAMRLASEALGSSETEA